MSSPNTPILISGGGTGGHLFPALAIADAIKAERPQAEILFVGAEGKIEMERVPAAGYEIVGLPVRGLQRSLSAANLLFPFKLIKSLLLSYRILKKFKPLVAVGVGGYASGPVMLMAQVASVPCMIQEQNSFPGVTNKILGRRARKIFVAYTDMDRFFEKGKLLLTGNPVRASIEKLTLTRHDRQSILSARNHFGLHPDKKVVLVLGGSLGARTINESILAGLQRLLKQAYQILWQTGPSYFNVIKSQLDLTPDLERSSAVVVSAFIDRMDLAYKAASVIISRAGAGTVSELAFAGRAAILVPSPNVAEDHQTYNALALVGQGAAIMVKDSEARDKLIDVAIALLANDDEQKALAIAIQDGALSKAAETIAREILVTADQQRS